MTEGQMPPALMAPEPEHADGVAGRPGCRGEVKGPRRWPRTGRCLGTSPSLCLLTEIFQPAGADTMLVLCGEARPCEWLPPSPALCPLPGCRAAFLRGLRPR